MPPYLWVVLGLVAAASALFFALANSALRSFSRARLEEQFRRRNRLDSLRRLYEHHDDLLQMARSLSIVSLVVLTALAEAWAINHCGPTATGYLVGAAAAAIVGVIVAGVIPLAWAKYAAESVLLAILPACHLCHMLFAPVGRVLALFDGLVRRLAGIPPGSRKTSHIEDEITSVLDEGEREGLLLPDQITMMQNVLAFSRTVASQIMTPRTAIVSIEAGATDEQARILIAQSGHSRIPVTDGNLDTIVGILYAKDLLDRTGAGAGGQVRVRDVCRKPLFVPETKRLDELLREFQGDKVHMAIVLDEYGGTAGLVTIEDVIEEIVGEIVDEYEQTPPASIRPTTERSFEVDARVHISELNRELSLDLPEKDDYQTVGGFVLARLGYIPKQGETLEFNNMRITVLEAEPRRVTRLKIEVPQRTQNGT